MIRVAHITQSGNISIPKPWRTALCIDSNSEVIMNFSDDKIVISPLKSKNLKDAFKKIDEEIKKKKIDFTREEAVRDDLYD